MLHSSTTAGASTTAAEQQFELPFIVRQPSNPHEMQQIASLRAHCYHRTYGRDHASSLSVPEERDFAAGNVVLGAFDKRTGDVIGTLRFNSNLMGTSLPVECTLNLPNHVIHARRAEAGRLAVHERAPTLVKLALFKACYQLCVDHSVGSLIATAMTPIWRQYFNLLFQDVFPDERMVVLKHSGVLPHRVLYLDIPTAPSRWNAAKHPLTMFMGHIRHRDIEVPTSLNNGTLLAAGSGIYPMPSSTAEIS